MSTKKKKKAKVPTSLFREVSVDRTVILSDEQAFHPHAIDHFRNLPRNQRSHEDFDELLKIVKVLTHNQKFEEKELWMAHKRIFGFTQANAGLIALNRKLARHLKNDTEGENENLFRVIKNYKRAILGKVVDVSLNGKTYTITRAHMMHVFEWYTTGGLFLFKRGDDYMGVGEDAAGCHKYQFGEIVQRTFFDRDGTEHRDEVIIFDESPFIADVVTAEELRRAGQSQKDGFTMPSFVWKEDIAPLSPRRFVLEEQKMTELMHKMVGLDYDDKD